MWWETQGSQLSYSRTPEKVHLSQSQAVFNDVFDAVEAGDMDQLASLLDARSLFAADSFDLTSFEQDRGYTILHLAISLGHDDIAQMLLARAGHDPRILDAKDRQGFTPLMTATAMRNVALMKTLIDAGARTNDSVTPLKDGQTSDAERVAATARMLVNADGDSTKAFELAVLSQDRDAAQLYLESDRLSVVQQSAKFLCWLINYAYVRVHDVLASLDDAVQLDNQAAREALTRPDVVLATLAAMTGQSEPDKLAVLTSFMSAGADTEQWLGEAVQQCLLNANSPLDPEGMIGSDASWRWQDLEAIRLMVAVGVPTIPELSRLGERGDVMMAQRLISFGADAVGAMKELDATNKPAANVVAYAALNSVLHKSDISEEQKIQDLKTLVREGALEAAGLLIEEESTTGSPYAARLLKAAASLGE